MLNCQRLQYEIPFILCSCKIESSEREKIARKHRYTSFEFCEMESLKKKTFNYKVKRKRADQGIVFALNSIKYKNKIRIGSFYICCVCNRLLYKGSVHIFGKANTRVKIFSVCSLHLMENSIFVKHVT